MIAHMFKSLSVLVFMLVGVNAFAGTGLHRIELTKSASEQRAHIPEATLDRIQAAVLAGYDSDLLARAINGSGVTLNDFEVGYVTSIKTVRFGALELEIEFPFPQNSDPCSAHLKIISYRDGTHSVRETLIYGGAARGNVMGVLSCQD